MCSANSLPSAFFFSSALLLTAASPIEQSQIVRGSDRFAMTYRTTIPASEFPSRLWLPFARSDDFQTVKVKRISAPAGWQLAEDATQGNWIMALEITAGPSDQVVEIQYEVHRREKASYASGDEDVARYLRPDRLVPRNKTFQDLAGQVTRDQRSDFDRGRALYRHTLERMKYDKTGDGWGQGDAVRACDARTGNCTDFHAYFIALCRAVDIPARFAIGFTIPADSDSGALSGYHCWAEFHAEGRWVPVDISEADKYHELADYYFGHHPANRFELSAGRDLVVDPAPAMSPLNFLVYPHLERQGEPQATMNEFHFRREVGLAAD